MPSTLESESPYRKRRRVAVVAGISVSVLLTSTLFYFAGQGLLADDFYWIRASRIERLSSVFSFFQETSHFYRPLIHLVFGLNEKLAGAVPWGYALFNLLLHAVNLFLFGLLVRKIAGSWFAGLLALSLMALESALFVQAVLWNSGRTVLLESFFSLVALLFLLPKNNRPGAMPPWTVLLAYSAALLCKEGAVLLFLTAAAVRFLPGTESKKRDAGLREIAVFLTPFLILCLLYLWVRQAAGAFQPWNAPGYYRFGSPGDPGLMNLIRYLVRSMQWAAFPVLLWWIAGRKAGASAKADAPVRRIWLLGAVWFLAAVGPSLLVPVRSNLYVYFACMGTALALSVPLSIALQRIRKWGAWPLTALIVSAASVTGAAFQTAHQARQIAGEQRDTAKLLWVIKEALPRPPDSREICFVVKDPANSPLLLLKDSLSDAMRWIYRDEKVRARILSSRDQGRVGEPCLEVTFDETGEVEINRE